ncbi:MAG: glucose 1-dehydrogenase [Syntrophorhabdales bacterium]|jgi:2-deoxy-D-gluconate 3-dehydrogenase
MKESAENFFSLKGKVAIVTGGNGGIGKGIARGLAGVGATIVIAARNKAKTDAAVAEIKKDFGVEALSVIADMRQPAEIEAMVKQTADTFGGVNIVVANAGIGFHKAPTDLTIAEWDENIEINLRHTFVVSKAAYPYMRKAGGGKIITLGSMTSIFGIAFLPSYGASKGGILQLSRSLAVAWARDNIQVNCILPGFIDSGLSAEGRREVPGFEEAVKARTPAGRWGDPIDVAGTAVFLASPASDFVTGAGIPVDGGYAVQG